MREEEKTFCFTNREPDIPVQWRVWPSRRDAIIVLLKNDQRMSKAYTYGSRALRLIDKFKFSDGQIYCLDSYFVIYSFI